MRYRGLITAVESAQTVVLAITNDSCSSSRTSGSFFVSRFVRASLRPSADPSALVRQTASQWLDTLGSHWRRRIAWNVFVAAAMALTGLLLFAKIGEDVFQHESGSFDDSVRNWMLAHQTPALFRVFTWVTNAGSTVPILALTAIICMWLWQAKARHAAAGAIAAPVVATALFNAIKLTYGRARPAGALHFGLRTYAFPSGHATVSMAAAATVAYVLWRERLLRGKYATVIAIFVPLVIGFSRTYLDVHWATDVLGAWCVGLFVAGLSGMAYERLRRDPPVAVVEGASALPENPPASAPSPVSS